MVSDIASHASSVTKMVIGMYARNFPKIPGSVSIGRKAKHVVAVHAIREYLYSCTARRTACLGLKPSLRFSWAHSMTTSVVSIAIPKQIIKLKLVKKFIDNPNCHKTKKVIQKAIGIEIAAIADSLNQTKINIQRKTNAIVERPLFARSI
jgi:hypothetical protein